MTLREVIKTVFLTEILQGMALTLKTMFTKPVTRQYPEEKRPAMPGFRGMHAFVRDPETGKEKCIACGLCASICPSQCIYIHTKEDPDTGRKAVEKYEIEVLRCIFCAFCVEACPVGAIALSEHFEYSDHSRQALYMDKERLLSNWDTYMAGEKGRVYFEKFWHPVDEDYRAYDGQATLGRMKSGRKP